MSSFKIYLSALLIVLFSYQMVLAGSCLIKVDFARAKLIVSEYGKKQKKIFTVGLPRYKLKNMPIKGRVLRIEKNPCWIPTKHIKEYYREKYKIELPDFIGPDEPDNPMGVAKIIIEFKNKNISQAVTIHGTEDLESIGKRQSLGCVRMKDEDIMALIKFISGKKTNVVFE